MDLTVPLTVLAIFSMGVGFHDLYKSGADDVLRVGLALEAGLLLGVASSLFVPGGFFLGAVGGFALAATRFQDIGQTRAEKTQALMLEASDDASSLLVLHDRLDALSPPRRTVRRVSVLTSLTVLGFVGLGLIGIGLSYDLWFALLLGTGFLFLPITQAVRVAADTEEHRVLAARLLESRDHAAGVASPVHGSEPA